ncbi:hypothetical protein JCM10213_002675 [Rhodosporidiobolus nylandii]
MSVTLQPSNQLAFQRPLTQLVKRNLSVSNHNSQAVAYKVKTTSPKGYCVRPNAGRIESGETVEVQVLLQPMKEDPPANAKCRDKFLVQSVIITPDKEDLGLPELWQTVEREDKARAEGAPTQIFEQKIRCAYLPAADSDAVAAIPEETHQRLNSASAADSSFVSTLGTPSSASKSSATAQSFGTPSPTTMSPSDSREAPPSPSPPQSTLAAKAQDAAAAVGGAAANAAASAGAPNLARAIEENTPAPAHSSAGMNGTHSAASGEDPQVASLKAELASAKAEISRLKDQLDQAETTAATLRSRGVSGKLGAGDESVAGAGGSTAVVEMKGAEGVPVQVVVGVAFGVFVVTWLFF